MTKNKQTGAVLIVSLLMLTVMTMIGVTAMQSNLLQEKMAGNFRDMNVAFQAAEVALRDAETDIFTNISGLTGFNTSCTNGLCDATTGFNQVWKNSATKNKGVPYGTNTNATAIANVSCQPKYWIEGFKAKTFGGQWQTRSRVTTTACGGNPDTQVILQAVYKP